MGKNKRKQNPSSESPDSSKRPRQSFDGSKSSQSISYGRVDPTFGQRSAIPGLDDYSIAADDDYDLDYSEDADALSYLKSVRLEACGIPTLLVAPRPPAPVGEDPDRSIYESGIGDSRGFYEDGAYTATRTDDSPPESEIEVNGVASRHPQKVYHEKILERLMAMKDRLSQAPPRHVAEKLDKDHSSHMSANPADFRMWRWRIGNTEVLPAQLAGMDKSTVLRLLRLAATGGGFLSTKGVSGRTSRWIWGLLARLPERGELVSEEVGVVRELGKKAVWVGISLTGINTDGLENGEGNGEEEEILDMEVERDDDAVASSTDNKQALQNNPPLGSVDDHSKPSQSTAGGEALHHDKNDDEEDDLATARARILSALNNSSDVFATDEESMKQTRDEQSNLEYLSTTPDQDEDMRNTRATIDMIITVAGELYGQRDLLPFREAWE